MDGHDMRSGIVKYRGHEFELRGDLYVPLGFDLAAEGTESRSVSMWTSTPNNVFKWKPLTPPPAMHLPPSLGHASPWWVLSFQFGSLHEWGNTHKRESIPPQNIDRLCEEERLLFPLRQAIKEKYDGEGL